MCDVMKLQEENEKQNEALKENAVMISGMSSDVMILQERNKKLQEENEKLKEENEKLKKDELHNSRMIRDLVELAEQLDNVKRCCDSFGYYEEGATTEDPE